MCIFHRESLVSNSFRVHRVSKYLLFKFKNIFLKYIHKNISAKYLIQRDKLQRIRITTIYKFLYHILRKATRSISSSNRIPYAP